jgi:hypothetical protein
MVMLVDADAVRQFEKKEFPFGLRFAWTAEHHDTLHKNARLA